MLLAQKETDKTEESIVKALHAKGLGGPLLLDIVQKKDRGISKETFYRILRKLVEEEVVTRYKGTYELNRYWLQRLHRFSRTDADQGATNAILSFKECDKVSYKFKNPNLMGIYWAHTYDVIFENHDPNIPILIFHPHEWLIHARTLSETFFLNRFQEDKKLVFFTIGGKTEIDKGFKKQWENKFVQIGTGIDYGLKKTEYINVLGDFIFKVSVSKKFADDIERFFNTHNEINGQNLPELEKLCNRNDGAKMIFTRSQKEADKWRTKFKKHFFMPKSNKN